MAGIRLRMPWADRRFSFTSFATIDTTLPEYVEVDPDNELNEDLPPPPHEPTTISDNQIVETPGPTPSFSRPLVLSDGSRYDPLSGYWITNPEYLRLSDDRYNQSERQWPAHRVRYGMAVAGHTPWAKLYIYGRKPPPSSSGANTAQFPSVYGGGAIHGLIDLNIQDGSRSIHRISIKLRGKLVSDAASGDDYTFCEETLLVWDKSTTSPSAHNQLGQTTTFVGCHKFPFRFPFPTHVDLRHRRLYYAANPSEAILDFATSAGSGSPIPACQPTSGFRSLFNALAGGHSRSPNQSERNQTMVDSSLVTAMVKGSLCPVLAPLPHSSPATMTCGVRVKYDLIMTITHGRQTPNTSIKTTIRHIPRLLVPSLPVSQYSDQLYPEADPGSWVEGKPHIFRGRGVDAKRSLQLRPYLSKPGVYLPAGTIRICLLVELDGFKFDSVALDPSKYPRVVLVRRHDYLDILDSSMPTEAPSSEEQILAGPHLPVSMAGTLILQGGALTGETLSDICPSRKGVSGRCKTASKTSNVTDVTWAGQREADVDFVDDARVKPPGRLDATPRRLWMFGSIVLPGDLEPSSMCPIYRIQYSLDMVPPDLSRRNSMFGPNAPCKPRPDGMAPTLQLFRIEIGTLPQPERPP